MKLAIPALASLLLLTASAFAVSDCAASAKVIAPSTDAKAKAEYTEKLNEARAALSKDPDSADALVWVGRRTAYLGNYKEAIGIFSEGVEKFPSDARFLRHRGHRFLSIRCVDEAIADLEKAASLVKGKPDKVEPDGLPNAKGIPTSTLQSNIFYHLGLSYYVKGDFKNALKAYEKCLKVSKNPDMFVATQNWHYLTLMRLGKKKEAAKVLSSVRDGDKVRPETLLTEIRDSSDNLQNATMGYGIGTYFLIWGDKEKAETIYRKILETDQWSSFGYIAAEAEIARN
jgi:tetratricopeptide (TPR) repeat protein